MKRPNPIKGLIILTVLAGIFIMGCSKSQTENKLQGRWQRVFVNDIGNPTLIEDWEFLGDGNMRVYSTADTAELQTFKNGSYIMESYREFTIAGEKGSMSWDAYSGKWRIVKLKKDILIIVRQDDPGGLTFREFQKI